MAYSTGISSYSTTVVVGYVDRDDHLDIAVVNGGSSNICILLGNGNGTFADQTISPTGSVSDPADMVLGYFNRDNHIDLAIITYHTNNIGIWLGNGNGTFAQEAPFPLKLDCRSKSIATGDFNRDGQLDLALACEFTNNVVVFFGTGNGTFSGQIVLSTGLHSGPTAVAVDDFNCDNYLDLAVVNRGKFNVGVSLGDSNGTFGNQKTYPTGPASSPYSMVVGDFNNDNILDIAVTNSVSHNVGIFLGTGNGTFLDQVTYPVEAINSQSWITAGDFNSDGKLDLVIIVDAINYAYILLNSCHCCLFEATTNCKHSHA